MGCALQCYQEQVAVFGAGAEAETWVPWELEAVGLRRG